MKHLRYILLATVLASGSVYAQSSMVGAGPGFVMPGQAAAAPAQAAAAQALRNFIATVDVGQALPPGFPLDVAAPAALKQARIGWGFAVHDVQPDSLRAGTPLARAAQETGQWRYAVMVLGKPVGLLTMEYTGKEWRLVSIGGAGMSRDVQALVARYGNQRNVRLRYLRVPQATADFIEVSQGAAPARYAPLSAARESLGLRMRPDAGLLDAAELMPGLRQAATRNLNVMY